MNSQHQQPITHTEQPATPEPVALPQLPQYWVTLPEVILAVATLTGASATLTTAVTELVRVLKGRRKQK
ncbi:MAG: hypothetical protein VKL59_03750 [Nostocaceae cyanobacterium]|nr:hypothetical protein [Nostocaceae cyanobacterium]